MADRAFVMRIAGAMRLPTMPLSLMSVAVAAASSQSPVAWSRLGLCTIGVASLHVAGILVSDLFDHRAGTDRLAGLDRSAVPTGSLQLEAGTVSRAQVTAVAVATLGIGALAVVLLADGRLAVLYAVGVLLVTQYAGPPLRVAYVGSGLGEVLLLAAYGPLPAIATGIALEGRAAPAAIWASTIVGALIAMGLASHHLLHWRADRAATKRTPVVAYGEEGALALIGLVDIAAYGALIVGALIGMLPVLALAAVVGAPVVGLSWRRSLADPLPQRTLQMIGAHLGAATIAALAFVVAFVLA